MADNNELLHLPQPGKSSLIARGRKDAASLALRKEPLYLAAVKLDGKWGFIRRDGEFVIQPLYSYVDDFCAGMAAFTLDHFESWKYKFRPGRWGYLDLNGRPAVPPREGCLGDFSEGLACVDFGKMKGFIGRDGAVLIEPRFHEASRFKNGRSVVLVEGKWETNTDSCLGGTKLAEGKWALIDQSGTVVGHPSFDRLDSLSEGLAVAGVHDKVGFIDGSGEFAIAPLFDDASPFSGGRACVQIGRKYGMINKSGEFVLEPKYSTLEDFCEGTAKAELDGFDLLINGNGQIVFRCDKEHEELGDFHHDVALVYRDVGNSYYIDRFGKRLTDSSLDALDPDFTEGRGLVERFNRRGFVDKHGQLVIDTQFVEAGVFCRGYTTASRDGEIRMPMDMSGNFVRQPRFHSLRDLREGLIRFEIGRTHQWGFIDEAGGVVVEAQYNKVENFSNGLAAVRNDGGFWGYIDRTGKVAIHPRFEMARDFQRIEPSKVLAERGLADLPEERGGMV